MARRRSLQTRMGMGMGTVPQHITLTDPAYPTQEQRAGSVAHTTQAQRADSVAHTTQAQSEDIPHKHDRNNRRCNGGPRACRALNAVTVAPSMR
eukprot:364956-Chlamydomonas_euryale.AAC.5